MKTFLLILALIGAPLLKAQELEKRAQEFADRIADTDASEKKYVKRIVRYFDPESNPDSTAQAHYDWWSSNDEEDSYPISWKVLSVDYPSESEGLVQTESLWHYPGGAEVRFILQTQWVLRGKKWYRTPQPQVVLESRQIK